MAGGRDRTARYNDDAAPEATLGLRRQEEEEAQRMMPLLDALSPDLAGWEALSLVFSNLEVACRKSGRPNQARLFETLAKSCAAKARNRREQDGPDVGTDAFLDEALAILKTLRETTYEDGRLAAAAAAHRGVLRTMVWGQKVTAIQAALVGRLRKKGADLLGPEDKIHVCTACGFLAVKGQAPEVCPICKAPHRQFVAF